MRSMDKILASRPAGEIRLRGVALPEKALAHGAFGIGPAANLKNRGRCSAESRHLKMRNPLQINSTTLP